MSDGVGGALLAQDFDGLIDLGITNCQHGLFDRATTDVRNLEFRKYLEDGGEIHLAFDTRSLGLDTRLTGHAQILFAYRLTEGFFDCRADGFGAGLLTIHLRHHFHGHLAGTEPRHLGALGHPLELLFHLAFDIGQRHGHFDAAFQCTGGSGLSSGLSNGGFLSRFHEKSLK